MSVRGMEYDLLRAIDQQPGMSTTLVAQTVLVAGRHWPDMPSNNSFEYGRLQRKVYRMLRSNESIWFYSWVERGDRHWALLPGGKRGMAEYQAEHGDEEEDAGDE